MWISSFRLCDLSGLKHRASQSRNESSVGLIFCAYGQPDAIALRIAVPSSLGLCDQLYRPSDSGTSICRHTVFLRAHGRPSDFNRYLHGSMEVSLAELDLDPGRRHRLVVSARPRARSPAFEICTPKRARAPIDELGSQAKIHFSGYATYRGLASRVFNAASSSGLRRCSCFHSSTNFSTARICGGLRCSFASSAFVVDSLNLNQKYACV
jgi:hypothetical protein